MPDQHETFPGQMQLVIDRMRVALLAAAEQFSLYAAYHLAKQPPDTEKALVNAEWAQKCIDAADGGVAQPVPSYSDT